MKTPFGAKDAVMDFRALHGIEDAAHAIRDIDRTGAFWVKAKEVAVKRDLYLNAVRTKGAGGSYADLRPKPLLTGEQYADTHKMWEKAQPPSRTALGLRGFTKCKLVPGSKEVGNTGFCGLCQRDRYTPLGPNDGKSIEGDWTE
jgi:hypothetical protein